MTLNENSDSAPLSLLGERRIVDELIKPAFSSNTSILRGIGDDTAALQFPPGHEVLVTTDPCPMPVVALLGDGDLWHWGRLTHVICLSDLAASGGEPLGMLVSTVMPEKMLVSDYRRYLEALEYYAQLWNCPIIGGNIKDGTQFSSCATALGTAPRSTSMTRTGARPGDAVCVVGKFGHFWSSVLVRMRGWSDLEVKHTAAIGKALNEPMPRVQEGLTLRRSSNVSACIDASDGLGAALESLAVSNDLELVIDESLLPLDELVRDVADQEGLDPLSLLLSWGDWQLAFTTRESKADELVAALADLGAPCRVVGHIQESEAGQLMLLPRGERTARPIRSLASERFRDSSYFTHGLESYVDLMRLGPFLENHSAESEGG